MNPIAKKLLIKPGKSWLFYNAPENYLSVLEPMPEGVAAQFNPRGNFDGIQVFAINNAELAAGLKVLVPLLKTDTIFWVTYPKKSSGIESDLEMMGSWDELKKYGLRTVAAAGIDETWTAIRIKPDGQSKVSEFCNEEIKKNEHAAFIDLGKRQINLPPDMQKELIKSPGAMTFYESLSFSNKKEYVVWILSAKQEKTKNERLEKLTEKLLAKKKNPAEK
jgi:hypothetical protein